MNPRQIAIVAWGAIAVVALVPKPGIRRSVAGVVKAMMARQFVIASVGSLLWNAAVIYALHCVGFWDASLWWDTTVFVLIGTLALVWRMMEEKDYTHSFFVKAALTNLGIGVLLETFVSTYTFGLVTELVLVPWLFLLGAMLAVAQSSDQYRSIVKPLTFLVSVTGLAMLSHAVAGAIADQQNFLTMQTLQWLLLPFVLTAAFLPYLFALRVWTTYELACIPLKLGEKKSRKVRWYAVVKMLLEFGWNLSRLERFRTSQGNDLRSATTRQAVDEVLERAT
jgi:hypothetical protein